MEPTPDKIASFPLPLFQRFAARCCRRVERHITDNRFEKILRKLERCSGLSPREQLRRDAFNAANAAYRDLYQTEQDFTVPVAAMCTLVCACDELPNANLLGNFRSVLERGEGLQSSTIRQIEIELLEGLSLRTASDDQNAG